MDNIEIGLYLKGLRMTKGLSQGKVASICSVSHQAVSKWEKGESLPDLSSLQLLGSFYGITIDEILSAQSNEIEEEKLEKDEDVDESEYEYAAAQEEEED